MRSTACRRVTGRPWSSGTTTTTTTTTNVGAMLSRALDQLKVALDPVPRVIHETER